MALLASCWLLVESFIIPDGLFLKLLYLSCYINPFFLPFFQIFLWLSKLIPCFLLLFSFLYKILGFLSSFIFKFFNKISIFFFPVDHPNKAEVFYDAMDKTTTHVPTHECYELVVHRVEETASKSEVFLSKNSSSFNSCNKDSWLNEYLYSDHFNGVLRTYYDDSDSIVSTSDDSELQDSDAESKSCCPDSDEQISSLTAYLSQLKLPASGVDKDVADHEVEDSEINCCDSVDNLVEYLPDFCSLNSLEDADYFHQKYMERMRFFEVLYHERLYGLDAILNEHIDITSPISFKSADFSMQYISWNKIARKELMKSLEYDFELIYVAQLCLSWEALHHQYHKVEALTLSDNSEKLMFHHSVSGKFQEFQVLLERFVEEGQRYSRHKAHSFQGLVGVPDVSGFMVEEGYSMGGEAIKVTQVLKAIEKCINAFWVYLKTDNKKSFWKYKGIFGTQPPVEDPRDLELLYNVTQALHKKWILLKDLEGKKRCWLRTKVKPIQEQHEKRSLLFAMIEMKLVQRLLEMSVISSSHLKWCQDKLNNLEFRHGKVFRSPVNDHLFPTS